MRQAKGFGGWPVTKERVRKHLFRGQTVRRVQHENPLKQIERLVWEPLEQIANPTAPGVFFENEIAIANNAEGGERRRVASLTVLEGPAFFLTTSRRAPREPPD